MDLYSGGFLISKNSRIFCEVLCYACKALHGDLQVLHADF